MQKVKEEFFLSLIFVIKWLLLGLGALGIIYFAISLAYHSSYYDPLMKEYQIKVIELTEKKENAKTSLETISSAMHRLETKIDVLEKTEIPTIEKEIVLQEEKIESLGESLLDKYNPFSDRDEITTKVYDERDNAIEQKEKLYVKLEALHIRKAMKSEEESEILENLNEINIMISVQEHEQKKVGTGALGVFPWLLSILW